MRTGVLSFAMSVMVIGASVAIYGGDVLSQSQSGEIQLQLGHEFFREGRFADSLEAYRKALKSTAPVDLRAARDTAAGAVTLVGGTNALSLTGDLKRIDEEVGRGTERFDIEAFGAEAAYTLDGSGLAELEIETFSARQVRVTIRGRGAHPGTAKGKLVNAVKLAAEFVASLPQGSLSPETTEGREGFVHPSRLTASVEEAVVTLIVRDHDDALLDRHTELVRSLAVAIEEREPRARVEVEVKDTYRNMRAVIDEHPRVVAAAEEAIRRAGLEPVRSLIRGGTDGARLSEMGLPTPNVFTGGQNYHSLREWASVQDMAAAAATVVELVRVWGERA